MANENYSRPARNTCISDTMRCNKTA